VSRRAGVARPIDRMLVPGAGTHRTTIVPGIMVPWTRQSYW
jgi:hypothetical protein